MDAQLTKQLQAAFHQSFDRCDDIEAAAAKHRAAMDKNNAIIAAAQAENAKILAEYKKVKEPLWEEARERSRISNVLNGKTGPRPKAN